MRLSDAPNIHITLKSHRDKIHFSSKEVALSNRLDQKLRNNDQKRVPAIYYSQNVGSRRVDVVLSKCRRPRSLDPDRWRQLRGRRVLDLPPEFVVSSSIESRTRADREGQGGHFIPLAHAPAAGIGTHTEDCHSLCIIFQDHNAGRFVCNRSLHVGNRNG